MANKIVIEPVSRVEGHGKVTVYLNDQGNVDKSYLHITQVRGFEKFCEGRLYNEMLAITPRICRYLSGQSPSGRRQSLRRDPRSAINADRYNAAAVAA